MQTPDRLSDESQPTAHNNAAKIVRHSLGPDGYRHLVDSSVVAVDCESGISCALLHNATLCFAVKDNPKAQHRAVERSTAQHSAAKHSTRQGIQSPVGTLALPKNTVKMEFRTLRTSGCKSHLVRGLGCCSMTRSACFCLDSRIDSHLAQPPACKQ